jgi:hypothetical protein
MSSGPAGASTPCVDVAGKAARPFSFRRAGAVDLPAHPPDP